MPSISSDGTCAVSGIIQYIQKVPTRMKQVKKRNVPHISRFSSRNIKGVQYAMIVAKTKFVAVVKLIHLPLNL
eukprot:Awhi_evm2s14714